MKKMLCAGIVVSLFVIFCVSVVSDNALASSLRGKHASEGISCTDCHKTAKPTSAATEAACMECHGTYEKVAALTKKLHGNPHDSHLGQMDCTKCHGIHKQTVIPCLDCHAEFDFKAK